MSKCKICRNELKGIETTNWFDGLCEKCWQEKHYKEYPFKKGINEQDQKIKDLENKLAESKKQCQECKHLNKKIELNIKNKLMNEVGQLNRQLEEKDKKIKQLKAELVELKRKYELNSFPIGGLVDTVRKLEEENQQLKKHKNK